MRRILFGLACIVALAPIAQGATTPSLQSGGSAASSTSGLKASDLLAKIDKALARLPKPSAYLYETNSVPGKITSTWTEMTAGILGTRDLRVAYDNFYQTSVEYAGMVQINLLRAKRAAQNNDVEAANRLYQAALRYESQFYLNDKAAIETFNGNIDAVTVLTKGIYQGSRAAAIYGSSMVMGPVGSRVVDTVFSATDFAVESSENGLASAKKKLVADKLTEMIFSQATVGMLGGKTMKDALERGVTKTLGNPEVYKIVREVVSKPGFAKAFMSFMGTSGAYAVSRVTEDQVNKIVMAIVEEATTKLPTLTNPTPTAGSSPALPAGESNLCGSDVSKYLVPDYVCFDAQGERVPYAGCDGGRGYGTLVRYKVDFSGACKQHDLCYGKVGATKSQCDTELYKNLNSSCRTQLPSELGEKATRRCYETALLFNDVVRGQATNRFGIWMTQQVPFTGKSGCDAFVSAQRAAGNLNATCAQPQPGSQDTAEPKVSVAPNSATVAEKDAKQVGYAYLEKMLTKCNGLSYLKSRYLGNDRKEITDIREYKGTLGIACHEPPESYPKKGIEWSCAFEVNAPKERMNYQNEGWVTETHVPLMFGVKKVHGQWQVDSSFQKVTCNEVQGSVNPAATGATSQVIQTTVPPKNNADGILRIIDAVDLCHHWAGEVGDQTPERNKQIELGQKRDCPPAIKLLKENFAKYPNDTRLFDSVLRMNSLGIFELPKKEISRICSFMKKDNIYCQSADLATQDIRNIDFRNFTYDVAPWCGKEFGKTRVRIKDGGYGSQTDWWFGIWEMPGYASIVYGDLTGDGRDEAIVTTSCGGMHATEQPYVFTMKDGRVSLMTRLESGDRAFGGYHRITIKDGLLITERMQGKAACCPDLIERKTYKWSGTAFIQVGAAQRRPFK